MSERCEAGYLLLETYVIHSREGRLSVLDIDEGIACFEE